MSIRINKLALHKGAKAHVRACNTNQEGASSSPQYIQRLHPKALCRIEFAADPLVPPQLRNRETFIPRTQQLQPLEVANLQAQASAWELDRPLKHILNTYQRPVVS